nr:protein Lines homolog 1 [Misgurnus anguillicaudatus]
MMTGVSSGCRSSCSLDHIMDASSLDFQNIFISLYAGAAPSLSSKDLASRIASCLTSQTDGPVSRTDVMCLCLTLTENIITRLSSQSLPQDVRIYYEDVMRSLCEMDLMAKLVSLLGCQDQLVSHLSTKCMSACVINDISMIESSSSLWRDTCAEVFYKSTPSGELDCCLWSLTCVIKGVLRGDFRNKNDVLTKLLGAMDPSLTCLYASLLPQHTLEPRKTEVTKHCRTLCTFFDLLEVLSAARLRCGVCSSVQRTIFTESRALLHVMRTDVEYFVTKRALLLLKRNLLRRAGEDWALGDVQSGSHVDEGLNEDLLVVADAVLNEVKAGWLQEVSVKAQPSFFGGNCDVHVGGTLRDNVMLRALSLILLKSLEINIQSTCGKGAESNIDVQQYLTELMTFLRCHATHLSTEAHNCCWVTSVFAEQDDDMIESAKALIALYLYQKSLNFSVPVCLWGCNPHCHFIILLRSLSFDHTVLLDFLISTETCFLEYCVRYLKLLREDWTGFFRSCRHIEDSDGKLGGPRKLTANLMVEALSDKETPESSQMYVVSCARSPTGSDVRAGAVPRLVDYGSSDESEEADESSSDLHTNAVDFGRMDVEGSLYPSVTTMEQDHVFECLFDKVLACLEELKVAIMRLHNKGLFPYNPTSLLKLLNNLQPKKNFVSQPRLKTV